MRLISVSSEVYKMSESNYIKLLKAQAAEDDLSIILDQPTVKHIGMLEDFHIDMTPQQANVALVNLKKKKEQLNETG
jgi:hypothetical protein